MGRTLEALHRLQEIESRLAEFRRTAERRQRQVTAYQKRLAQHDQAIKQKHDQINTLESQAKSLELEVSTRENSTNKHREALAQAKTNKDYAAILTAINTEKADTVKLENQVLLVMTEIEKLREEESKLKEQRQEVVGQLEVVQKKLDDYLKDTKEETTGLQAQRDTAATDVPPKALESFNRVAAKHDGEAMAEIEKLHPKREDYVCGACNMAITLEQINALMSKDEIQTCHNCGWILYLPTSLMAAK